MSLKIAFVSALELEHNNTQTLAGHPVHITGLGKILAASKMTEIICLHKPDLVINFGSCGNLKSHKVGDILRVGTVHNDIDGRPLTDYGVTPFSDHGIISLDATSDIHCFTTDHFYDKTLHTDYRIKYLEMIASCNIVDMECYALANVCQKYHVPFHSYKWVSDDGESLDWRANAAVGFENFKKMIEETNF